MAAAAVIFVPLFVFFIKLIIQMGTIQGKIENISVTVSEHKAAVNEFNEVLYEMKTIKHRLDRIENQLTNTRGSPVS